jgi:presenilin-like A22 family membrane protease
MAPEGNAMHLDRRTIRYAAAGLSAVMAAIYFLIGVGVLHVVETHPGEPSLLYFGLPAGSAFLLGSLLLVLFDRRELWILGAVLQVLVVLGYFAVAASRTPAYEMWGMTLRLIQIPLFVALVYLVVRAPEQAGRARRTAATRPTKVRSQP